MLQSAFKNLNSVPFRPATFMLTFVALWSPPTLHPHCRQEEAERGRLGNVWETGACISKEHVFLQTLHLCLVGHNCVYTTPTGKAMWGAHCTPDKIKVQFMKEKGDWIVADHTACIPNMLFPAQGQVREEAFHGHYRNSIRIFAVKLGPPILEVLTPWLAFFAPQESVCLLGKEYNSLATHLCYVSLPQFLLWGPG